jgi:hypothetical protein
LGVEDPPLMVEIGGASYRRIEVLKHDSWAATALYGRSGPEAVCKFNRRQFIFGLPMSWLGKWLARHEARVLRRLEGLPHIPRLLGEVLVAGNRSDNAVAHDYVPGHPLGRREYVGDDFFPALQRLLAQMHKRNIAYVDLTKRGNIIVGEDGRPCIIDFQISALLPDGWPAILFPCECSSNACKSPISTTCKNTTLAAGPIRPGSRAGKSLRDGPGGFARTAASPFRTLRRRLLVASGIRSRGGRADSEYFPEDVVRQDAARKRDVDSA